MGRQDRRGLGPVRERDSIGAGGEDGGDGAVAGGAKLAGTGAGGLHAFGAIALTQAHEPEAGPVPLLGVGLGGEEGGDELGRRWARGAGPGDQTRGRPLGMRAVGGRHVGWIGRALAAPPTATMGGEAAALEEDLDRRGGEADLDALVHELVGDAVVVGRHDDVVVDVHGGIAPLAQLVAGGGQRPQERAVELLEELAA